MEETVSVRVQKIKKDYSKQRLIFFLVLAAALLLVVIFAQRICPYDPNIQDLSIAKQAPSSEHLAGTDQYGRDMFSRILVGLQTSISSTLILVGIICVLGTVVGVACGYFGGIVDAVIMRISDICLAFPGLVFAMAIAALLSGGLSNAIIALAVVSWPKYARIARSQTLALKSSTYIWASKQAGCSSLQIIWRHILPNSVGPILVTAMLDIGTMLMEIAGLSFLGLGAQPPTAELGSMMSGGRSMLQTYPWLILGPGLAIFIAVVIFNLLGDVIRDYLDPQSKQR
ncbi:Dipeptide transport system permease protein DppC [Lachnospiraceae bacterium TWA4]|nr:Dipeptide transport system permease protein DppC [Lachnospiraceae bacterium TWA4]